MRYTNLKKRNNSKISYVGKRLAIASTLLIAIFGIIIIPFTRNLKSLEAKNNEVPQVEQMDENVPEDLLDADNLTLSANA